MLVSVKKQILTNKYPTATGNTTNYVGLRGKIAGR
jgi:hypothetical protein